MIKHINCFVLIVCFIAVIESSSFATSLKVTWNANTETDLAGYKVYYSTRSGTYGQPIDVGNSVTCQINNIMTEATYYIAVTAYDISGNESSKSLEKSIYIPPIITLVSPSHGAVCNASPALIWTGNGFKSYKVYISITNGLIYNQVYAGINTSTTLDPFFVWLFIPPLSTITWYVEGTTTSGQVIKSKYDTFIKGF